ncbi:pilus assembly protein [Streptomyces sp. ISL-43]|uniref:TadE family protein n=1 Tax=Streptomyces sp. ISL-43 TaxID=2819183 RepID=UPI001BE4FD54|nr:TadE/TadG family type IV pilus assembly protein [Streptomyces sp. ISL-43]MBT2446059.1 pilus assembly protein [Streptomyces sp. ISL-43]
MKAQFNGRWRHLRDRLRQGGDRGSGSVELAVLATVVLFLGFAAIQTGMYFHARSVARSAATQGVEAGRQIGSSPDDGVAQAQQLLAKYDSVRSASVSAEGSGTEQIRITVRGTVATLVPGLELSVVQHAEAPVERWVGAP